MCGRRQAAFGLHHKVCRKSAGCSCMPRSGLQPVVIEHCLLQISYLLGKDLGSLGSAGPEPQPQPQPQPAPTQQPSPASDAAASTAPMMDASPQLRSLISLGASREDAKVRQKWPIQLAPTRTVAACSCVEACQCEVMSS